MDNEIRKRLRWVQLFEKLGNAGVACLKCGISRPTLRKWRRRYQERGLAGLQEESGRPKTSPNRKIPPEHLPLITELRKRKLGHRRIQNELVRLHNLSFSTATIPKALERLNKPLLSHKRGFINL
jgi:transposase-like protein